MTPINGFFSKDGWSEQSSAQRDAKSAAALKDPACQSSSSLIRQPRRPRHRADVYKAARHDCKELKAFFLPIALITCGVKRGLIRRLELASSAVSRRATKAYGVSDMKPWKIAATAVMMLGASNVAAGADNRQPAKAVGVLAP